MAGKSKFYRSQKAHLALNKRWHDKGSSPKNKAYGNYHADCYNQQRIKGRVLTRKEKKGIFAWWFNYEVNKTNR